MQLQKDNKFDTDEHCSLSSCEYIPQAFHDYQGVLILLVTLMYPRYFFSFQSQQVENPDSREFKLLERVWSILENDDAWKPAFEMVTKTDKDGLLKCIRPRIFAQALAISAAGKGKKKEKRN